MSKRLFVDMDGTLAEWRSFKYELTSLEDVQTASNLIYQRLNEENYFYNLKPQENVVNAVRNIVQNHKDSIDVYILSASVSDVATNDKNRWLDRYLPDIDNDHRIFTKDGEDKRNFVTGGVRDNDYLLDDRTLNLTQWVQTGKGIKLLNGQNHTAKTWKENMISCDTDPQLLAGKILSIINDNVRVQDTQPFHTEQTITIKPITVNAFENIEVWEDERKALQEQYLKIVRDTNFRALEWYTDLGGHYIFHPSVKSGDWQLSFIDNKGIPTSDSQYKDENIGTGKRWIDPLAEFPHSRADKTITIKALFENPNRERTNMEEDRILNNNTFYKNQEAILDDNVLVKSQPKMLVPRYAILQLAEGREETHRKRYESLDYLNEGGERPSGNEYEMIYFKVNDPNETNVNLVNVFQKFNADEPRPSDYYGHSLSVSDVVLVSDNGTDVKAYFCDRYGFNELDKDFITEKIQSRFETGTTIKEEHNLLATQENSNVLPQAMKERAKYINEEYSHIFSMADKRAVLEDTEKLNTVFDYEMLYGGENNTDSITVFNEQLNRVLLQPTFFNENSVEALRNMVDKKYFEALADKDLHNENLTYDNLLSFQKGDIITLNSGHKVEIQEAQLINRKDEPFPTRYEAEYEINDSYYFDPEFPNVTPETSFALAEVDYVERNGKFILEPPVIEQETTASQQNKSTYNPLFDELDEIFDENTYKYYSTQRPIGMGTFPRDNNIEFENYDTRTYVEAIGREAWGELLYSQPLTVNQLSEYELVADPSIKLNLSQRVSGDDLLNAQDLINDIASVGGVIDRYGNVTVYHRTDNKSVEKIKGTGIMVAKEDGLFFSTKENGQNVGYGEAVIKLSIPVEKLVIDDIFSDEVHLRYPLENTRRLNVSDYLVKDEPIREVTHGEEENLIGRIVTTNSYHAFGRDEEEKERGEKLNEHETEANLSLADRYTQAMKMAGFELLEKAPDSQTTFTFKIENSDRTIGFDNWREVGRYLEDVIITDDYLAPSFEELIHPQGRIQFVTQNLDGEGFIDNKDVNIHPTLESALKAYLDVSIVDGKGIGVRVEGQTPVINAISLAHFDTVDMQNHIHDIPHIHLLAPNATVNELVEIDKIYKTISTDLMKDNVYQKLQTSFDDISMSARTAIARQNSEWGSWFGHIANSNRPQDYVNVDITGDSTHHEVAYTVDVIHGNDVIDSKTLTVQTDENNLSETMEKAYVTAHNEFSEFLKEAVTKLDTDFDYPMRTYSPILENNMEQHYEQLTREGYETTPSYETFRNTQKQNELASKIYNFYLNSDEAETDTMEQIKIELLSDNGKQYREDIYDYVQEHYLELSEEEKDNGLEIITEIDNSLESVARTDFEQSRGSLNETVKEIMQTLVDSDLERNNGIMSADMREALTVQQYTLDNDNKVVNVSEVKPIEERDRTDENTYISKMSIDEANDLTKNELKEKIALQEQNNIKLFSQFQYRLQDPEMQPLIQEWREGSLQLKKYEEQLEMLEQKTNSLYPHREDNSDITLHIKYQEPIKFNGFVTENDTITFSNREELDKYVNGEVAYDTLDNSVKKRDNEILQYADNAKGEIIWKAKEPKKEVDRKETKTMAEKTITTGNEELSAKDQLMQQLADGIKNTLDSEHFADWCKKQGRLYYNNYSLRNAMLTYLQSPEASYVCGYEKWKEFGRQVKQGAKGIKVLAPSFVKEYGSKGSLLASIRKTCNEQLKKDPTLEYATFRLGQSKLSFFMYKNGLYDVKVGNVVVMAHITPDEMRKFLDKSVIGKIPAYYNAITVFDVEDTTNDVEHLWVKDNYKKDELVLDDNGNPIKNKKGQFKILNSEERKARFTADINMTIKETDTGKMEVLYDTLKTISYNKGIPFIEADPSLDETLASGALGYFRHPTAEHDKGNIVVSSELSVTDKVAVAFHEMAHSDLHADIDWLKDEMDLDAGEKVTRQMKETQAEAVAYMTASNFGIETEHKSFKYIAIWSNGRELKDLEKSFDVIYNESRQLMKDIETELDTRGFNLAIEVKDKTPMLDDVKAPIVSSYKEVVLNAMRDNETVQKTAFDDFKVVTDELQKGILKEQIALSHKIDEQISKLNERVDTFEKSTDLQEQVTLRYQMKADVAKITSMQTQLNNLSEERVTAVLEHADEKKNDMKALYARDPVKAMEQLQKENVQMKDLTKNDLKYLATSKFISREYCKYLGSDNQKFVDLSLKQLDNLKEVMSKNKTAVEISFCEQWGDTPIFEEGTLVHPKIANMIIAQAEKQTKEFKKKAESENDYYPYSKCDVSIYSVTGKDKMTVLNTRVDIGDGEQKDLTDHLTQICSKGKERQSLLENFTKSTRERGETLLLTPQIERVVKEARVDERSAYKTLSMSDWKSELNISSGKETKDKVESEKDNSEKERA